MLTNVHNGLATTAFSGPKGSGGFWVDGSLQLTPGKRYFNRNRRPLLRADVQKPLPPRRARALLYPFPIHTRARASHAPSTP